MTTEKKLSFDAKRFLRDYGVDHTTEHHHCTRNRVNIHCPFCVGSRNYHLGIHITNGYGNCWRCGSHSILEIVHTVLRTSWKDTYKILEDFSNVRTVAVQKTVKRTNTKLIRPPGIQEITKQHKQYLERRNYNVDDLVRLWGIKSTGFLGDYKHRIYIPIDYLGEAVSHQCRTIVKNTKLRYMTCSEKNEKIHHKHIVYGLDKVAGSTVVVVEGITDVWRLGPGAVATFGISYTKEQMFLLSRFDNVYIMFDKEPAAQERAKMLAREIAYLNKKGKVHLVVSAEYDCDPGDLPQQEASKLMQEIYARAA